jgi:dGTPase
VLSLLRNTEENKLQMDPVTMEKYETLHKFMYSMVYENPYAKGEENKVPNLISSLYHYFIEHQSDLPDYLRRIAEEDGPETASGDYIAGMTDRFAVEYYENLFVPKSWNIGL